MKLKYKMLVSFLSLGLIPAFIVGLIALQIAGDSLTEQAYNQLTSIRAIKQSQIESYFDQRRRDITMLKENVARLLNQTQAADLSSKAHNLHNYFAQYIEAYDYYDLFLIDADGQIIYTVAREADYKSNLVHGPYRDSGLGKLFDKVAASKTFRLQDFTPYAPSNNDPAAFIALPIEIAEQTLVLALQLSLENINAVMQQRDGMGETGETYLVGQDLRMRSNSYLDPTGHSVLASFKGNITDNGVDTQAVQEALKGVSDTKIIIDYNGNPVLSAFTALTLDDFRWVLLAEIDEAEAMAPVLALKKAMVIILALTIASVLIVTFVIVRSVIRPLGGEPDEMQALTERIAEGDLSIQFNNDPSVTGVYGSMKKMSTNLSDVMGRIIDASGQLSSTASQTSATSVQTNMNLHEQQGNVASVSTAMLEMSATIQEVARNANEVADAVNAANDFSHQAQDKLSHTRAVIVELDHQVGQTQGVIDSMAIQSQEIGAVLEVIRGIAEQTNLLALNAAIEAARAGKHGQGFAVVADEVRQLAQKTQESTRDIEDMITKLRTGTQNAVEAMKENSACARTTLNSAEDASGVIARSFELIDQLSANAEQIASAAVQQSHAAEEISQSLVNINDAAVQNAAGAEQTAAASTQLNGLAHELNEITSHFQLHKQGRRQELGYS